MTSHSAKLGLLLFLPNAHAIGRSKIEGVKADYLLFC